MAKKLLAIILSVTLILSIFPFSAIVSAESTTAEINAGLNDGEYYAHKIPATGNSIGQTYQWTSGSGGGPGWLRRTIDGENFAVYDGERLGGETRNTSWYSSKMTYGSSNLPEDLDISNTTALAIRIKTEYLGNPFEVGNATFRLYINGGQKSATGRNNDYTAYFLDKTTGSLTKYYPNNGFWDNGSGYIISGVLDGWMIVPYALFGRDAETMKSTYTGIQFFLDNHATAPSYNKPSDWSKYNFMVGDSFFIEDMDEFAANRQPAVKYGTGNDDSAQLALKVPAYTSFYGNTSYGAWYSATISKKINCDEPASGENGYAHTVNLPDGRIAVKYNINSTSANTSFNFGISSYQTYDKQNTAGSSSSALRGIPSEIDMTKKNALAIRFALRDNNETPTEVGFIPYMTAHGGQNAPTVSAYKNVKFIDAATNEISDMTYNGGYKFTGNVDGWLVIDFNAWSAFTDSWDAIVSNWGGFQIFTSGTWNPNNEIYISDCYFVDKTQFLNYYNRLNNEPVPNVYSNGTSIIGEAVDHVLYSEDEQNWSETLEIENISSEDIAYTVYYKWTDHDEIYSTDVWAHPYATHRNDTASYVYRPSTEKTYLGQDACWAGEGVGRDANDTVYYSGSGGRIPIKTIDNERFLKFMPMDNINGTNCSINLSGGDPNRESKETVGFNSTINTENLTALAYRIKVTAGSSPEQYSNLGIWQNNGSWQDYYSPVYYIDNLTNTVRVESFSSATSVRFDGNEFDGWIIIPFYSAAHNDVQWYIDNFKSISLFFHNNFKDGDVTYKCSHIGSTTSSNWNGRTVYLGEIDVLEDCEKFIRAHSNPEGDYSPTQNSIVCNAKENVLYSTDKESWSTTLNLTGLERDVEYDIYVKWADQDFYVTEKVMTAPYSTRMGDTASYVFRVPDVDKITTSHISKGLGRNDDDTDWKRDSSGALTTGGYLHIKGIDGERFVQLKSSDDVSATIFTLNMYLGDSNRTSNDVGFNSTIDTSNLSAIAVHIKLDPGAEGQQSAFIIRPDKDGWPYGGGFLFDPATGTTTNYTYGYKFSSAGYDGWLIIPFELFSSFDWLNSFKNLSFRIYNPGNDHSIKDSSWSDRSLYVGDVVVLEDIQKFKAARYCNLNGGHNYNTVVVAPTATKSGYTSHTCSGCGDVYYENYIPATNTTVSAGLGFFHFSGGADNYGSTKEDYLEELEDVLAEGYVNTIFIGKNIPETVELCKKYSVKYWLSCSKTFDSQNGSTVEAYLATVDKNYQAIVDAGGEDLLLGFSWDEPIWSGMSPDDFNKITKALFETYGKRMMPIEATGIITKFEPQELTHAFEYVTDFAWDSYDYDVRDSALTNTAQNSQIASMASTLGDSSITTAKQLYTAIQNKFNQIIDHDFNAWFFPCAYESYGWTKAYSDESYMQAHLEFFDELLKAQAHPGGLVLYSYGWANCPNKEDYLSYRLPITRRATGEQEIAPEVEKYDELAADIIAAKAEYDAWVVNPVTQVPLKITVSNYSGTYDQNGHGILTDAPAGATVTYSTDNVSFTDINPQFTDAGTYTVYCKVSYSYYSDFEGRGTVTINKAQNRNYPQNLIGVRESMKDRNDGKIVNVDSTMEYRTKGVGDYIPATGETITGLTPGDYQVRFAEDKNYFASGEVTVNVPVGFEKAQNNATLSLKGDISANFYLDIAYYIPEPVKDKTVVKLTYDHSKVYSDETSTDEYVYDGEQFVWTSQFTGNKTYVSPDINGECKFIADMVPAQLKETVTVEILNDGEAVRDPIKYSAYDYCKYVIENEKEDTKLVTLCKSVINYAAYAQIEFGYISSPENIIGDEADSNFDAMLTTVAMERITDNTYKAISSDEIDSLSITSLSFMSLEKSAFRIYFDNDTSSYFLSSNLPSNSGMAVRKGQNTVTGKYYVEVYGIESGNLSTQFTITLTQNDGKAISFSGCALTYVRSVLRNESGNKPNLVNFCKSLYQYSLAADSYFKK